MNTLLEEVFKRLNTSLRQVFKHSTLSTCFPTQIGVPMLVAWSGVPSLQRHSLTPQSFIPLSFSLLLPGPLSPSYCRSLSLSLSPSPSHPPSPSPFSHTPSPLSPSKMYPPLGLSKDFSKSDSKYACARSAQKFPRNLPMRAQRAEIR